MASSVQPSPQDSRSTSSQRPSLHLESIAKMPALDKSRVNQLIRQLDRHITDIIDLSDRIPNAVKEAKEASDTSNPTPSSEKGPASQIPSSSGASEDSESGAYAQGTDQKQLDRAEERRRNLNTILDNLKRNESWLEKANRLLEESIENYDSLKADDKQPGGKDGVAIEAAMKRAKERAFTQNVTGALEKCKEGIIAVEQTLTELNCAGASRKEKAALNSRNRPTNPNPSSSGSAAASEEADKSTETDSIEGPKKSSSKKHRPGKAGKAMQS